MPALTVLPILERPLPMTMQCYTQLPKDFKITLECLVFGAASSGRFTDHCVRPLPAR